uniref:GATA-type domain-containing protein n=1 Tax=Mycena chlorophos TaxID=658473 RepID=A0ABQ0MBR1_MYCCL|nr:predicted protein [Mycena chlorophos]
MPAHPPHVSAALPSLGQTRCYWALLNGSLQFIFVDPVLEGHLSQQAQELIGKSLVSFVHPEEQASTQQDLGNVLDSRTLHGSVTRVRFSRLSRVRRELGYQGPQPTWDDAEKVALDSNYMAVDIVINWVAEGVVLCFLHAIVDLTPNDNDEFHPTEWTNWCGTPAFDQEHIQLLYRRLVVCAPSQTNMERVFQILANTPQKQLLISWPPDQEPRAPAARDFAKLVEDVQIGPDASGRNEDATPAKTSCTRRYKATQQAMGREVESIFIPHGSVIFACHKVNSPTPVTDMQQVAFNSPSYSAQTPFYDQHGAPYSLPASYNYLPQSTQPSHPAPYPQTASYSAGGQWSNGSSRSNNWPTQPPFLDTSGSNQRNISPPYSYTTPTDSDGVPAPRRRVSPTAPARESVGNGRNSGIRPVGVLKCSSCKATSSPEWRKGPSGKKELCNACGLRYARSRAKKEGAQAQRKRKEKGLVVKRSDSATPPSATSASSYSALPHHYDDAPFQPAGSPAASEAYPRLDDHHDTPSPPPSASNMNFVHYSTPVESHAHYQAGSFFTVPSPLSANPSMPSQDQASPMHSPATHSPSVPASFERERERDLIPPGPLSAEPRRRSILSQQ